MNDKVENRKHLLRGNFSLMLFLGVFGLLFFPWFFTIFISHYPSDPNLVKEYLAEGISDFFLITFVISFLVACFTIVFSIIIRSKWWIAIPFTLILLGMPILSWLLIFFVSQIVRLFYIPTVEDLRDTKDFLKISIKPRNKYLSIYEEFKNVQAGEKPYYFSLWQSTIAALLGGFLGGGLMLSVNYKQLGDKKRFAIGLTLSIILHFILILVVYGLLVSNEQMKFLYILPFLLFIPTLANLLYNEFLLKIIEFQVSEKNLEKASWWSVFGVVLISLIFFLFCIDPAILVLREFGLPLESFLY